MAAARRADILPVGFIGTVADFKDPEAFRARIPRAHKPGFESPLCVHPNQVPIISEEFAPSAAEVEIARGLVAEFEKDVGSGRAAFTYKGRMVDLPVADHARLVLSRHAAIEARGKS